MRWAKKKSKIEMHFSWIQICCRIIQKQMTNRKNPVICSCHFNATSSFPIPYYQIELGLQSSKNEFNPEPGMKNMKVEFFHLRANSRTLRSRNFILRWCSFRWFAIYFNDFLCLGMYCKNENLKRENHLMSKFMSTACLHGLPIKEIFYIVLNVMSKFEFTHVYGWTSTKGSKKNQIRA